MTTPTPDFAPASQIDIQQVPDRFRCQTGSCGQPVRVITLDLEDNSTEMECFGCMLARNMAILQALGEQGLLGVDDTSTQQE